MNALSKYVLFVYQWLIVLQGHHDMMTVVSGEELSGGAVAETVTRGQ